MGERPPAVHILASDRDGTFGGFTTPDGGHRLDCYDVEDTTKAAIACEQRIKKWPRRHKLAMRFRHAGLVPASRAKQRSRRV